MLNQVPQIVADYSYNTTTTNQSIPAFGWVVALVAVIIAVAFLAFVIASVWKTFQKAGKPGWASIIPIYNSWVLAEIAGKPGWWGLCVLLSFIPFIGQLAAIVILAVISVGVAHKFGKSTAFGIFGLVLFSIVGYAWLGFGDAMYLGNTPDSTTGTSTGGIVSTPPTDSMQPPTSAMPTPPVA